MNHSSLRTVRSAAALLLSVPSISAPLREAAAADRPAKPNILWLISEDTGPEVQQAQ